MSSQHLLASPISAKLGLRSRCGVVPPTCAQSEECFSKIERAVALSAFRCSTSLRSWRLFVSEVKNRQPVLSKASAPFFFDISKSNAQTRSVFSYCNMRSLMLEAILFCASSTRSAATERAKNFGASDLSSLDALTIHQQGCVSFSGNRQRSSLQRICESSPGSSMYLTCASTVS